MRWPRGERRCSSSPAACRRVSHPRFIVTSRTRLAARGRRVILDTSGEALARAIEAAPDMIKPNIDELAELLGHRLDGEAAIVAAARHLRERGIEWVVVSMGGRGAIFVTADAAVHAAPTALIKPFQRPNGSRPAAAAMSRSPSDRTSSRL